MITFATEVFDQKHIFDGALTFIARPRGKYPFVVIVLLTLERS